MRYVTLQILFAAAVVWPWNAAWPWDVWTAVGYGGVFAGAAWAVWAFRQHPRGNFHVFPAPKPHAQLIVSGPYRWSRHPMYTGILGLMLGLVLLDRTWLSLAAWLGLTGTLWAKARAEEHGMQRQFPAYAAFCQSVRTRLLPWPPRRGSNASP